jgi:hypothetical protein
MNDPALDPRYARARRALVYLRQGNPPPFPPSGSPVAAYHSGRGTVAVLFPTTDAIVVIPERIGRLAFLTDTATGRRWPLELVDRKNPPLEIRSLITIAHRAGLLFDEDLAVLDYWSRRPTPYALRSLHAAGAERIAY